MDGIGIWFDIAGVLRRGVLNEALGRCTGGRLGCGVVG